MTIEAVRGAAKYPQWDAGAPDTTGIYGDATAIFKQFYLPSVRVQLNSKRIMSRYIRRNTEDVAGEQAVMALNTGRTNGHAHVGELGRLPDPDRQKYENAIYRMRHSYGRIKITGPQAASSRNNRGAWLRALDSEMRGMVRDVQHEFNRIVFGDGSGRLARLTGGLVGTSYAVDLPGGFASNLGIGTQYLRVGMRVAVANTTGSAIAPAFNPLTTTETVFYIVSVDHATGEVEFAATPDGAAANLNVAPTTAMFIVTAASDDAGSDFNDTAWLKEPFGLAAIVDDANPFPNAASVVQAQSLMGGLDAATVDVWRAYINRNGGLPIPFDTDRMMQVSDAVDMLGDGVVDLWMTSHGIRRQYYNQEVQNRRYVGTMKLDGGFSALDFNGVPFVCDKDCTRGRIYGLDSETLHMFMETDYYWMDADGSVLQRMDNQDAYGATLFRYHQIGTDARNRNGVVVDVVDS